MEDALYRRLKLESMRQGRQIAEIVGDAVESYLREKGGRATTGAVAESWGVLRIDRKKLRRVLSEEEGLLDA